jgi:phenylpropionate dioxygenase-like ring-hydroxylating dioxygenase large terminal subunit
MTITSPSSPVQRAAQTGPRTPSALAPLVRNAWYVVAARDEFDRTLKQRWVLGEPVCFYETADGRPVVVDDRCAHRRFPLSRSILRDDDSIQCKYHGYRFGTDGQCQLIPGGGDPTNVSIRSYPTVQRGPFVWIWTGDHPEAADEDLIPFPSYEVEGEGYFAHGYYFNDGNYSLVHDNLLDLTHLHYLHGFESGFSDQALRMLKPEEFEPAFAPIAAGYIREWDEPLGDLYGGISGDDPSAMARRTAEARSLAPGFSFGVERFAPHDPDAVSLRKIVIPHCITPANDRQTHQFWMFWSNVVFPMGVEGVAEMLRTIFVDDQQAVGYIQQYAENDTRDGVLESSRAADLPALRFRRTLHQLSAAELR